MNKYKNMTYSVRKNGLYYRQVFLKGKRSVLYASTLQELYNKYVEFNSLKNKGIVSNSSIYMEGWSKNWLETYKLGKVEKGTYKVYLNVIRLYINPQLGKMKLSDIKEIDIVKMLNTLQDKPRQRKEVLIVIKQILDRAIDNNYIYKNVAKNIKLPVYKPKEKKPLSQSDINYIKLAAQDNYYCFMLLFMLYTGLRIEEVSALTWDDFDFDNKTIYIHKAIHWERNQPEIKGTKNNENAYIPILDVIYNRLYQEYNNRKSNIVFPMKTNCKKIMTASGIQKTLASDLKYINKIKESKEPNSEPIKFSYHTLRHTFACLLHKADIPLKEAQKLTRHKTSRVLLDIYTHLDEEDNNKAKNKLNDFVNNSHI